MPYEVRPMELGDIPQVAKVEEEAFPDLWGPTDFRRELNNRFMSYLVALRAGGLESGNSPLSSGRIAGEPPSGAVLNPSNGMGLKGWLSNLKHLFVEEKAAAPPGLLVIGFVGLWFMMDETHITSIAVKREHRRKGVGELLLVSSIELAALHNARVVTLEVRVSNRPAQLLYERYGFRRAGVRRGYYTDNNEDALIMTTDDINSPAYKEAFQRLKVEHQAKWGGSMQRLV